MSDIIILEVGKNSFESWESIIVRTSMRGAAGGFNFVSSQNFSGQLSQWDIHNGDECRVLVNDVPLITGYIEDAIPSYTKDRQFMSVSGRDKLADLVDCSYSFSENKGNEFNSKLVLSVITDLCTPYGIKVDVDTSIASFMATVKKEKLTANVGEPIFDIIQNLCMQIGVLPITIGNGNLLLTRAGSLEATDSLETGINILRGSYNSSDKDRYATYQARGNSPMDQTSTRFSSNIQPISQIIKDETIKRPRHLDILVEEGATIDHCNKRAIWEKNIRAGRSRGLNYSVQGWTQSSGIPWQISKKIIVNDSVFGIKQKEYIIDSVDFILDENGSFSELVLMDSLAYDIAPTVKIESTTDAGLSRFSS